MFLAITRKVPTELEPDLNLEVAKAFIETDDAEVARNIEAEVAVEYFAISLTSQNATLKKASIKAGPRTAGRAREIIEVEAGGQVVASAEIDA
jgi:hypothetical protein